MKLQCSNYLCRRIVKGKHLNNPMNRVCPGCGHDLELLRRSPIERKEALVAASLRDTLILESEE